MNLSIHIQPHKNNLILFSLLFIVAVTVSCHKKEKPVIKSGNSPHQINNLSVLNPGFFTHQITKDKIFIAGSDGKIITKSNETNQWQAVDTKNFNEKISSLATNDTGKKIVAVGESGLIALSENAGKHWQKLNAVTEKMITAVVFDIAHQRWIAVGEQGVILQSDLSGHQWQSRTIGTTSTFSKIIALPTHLIAIGENGLIAQSTDGGTQWKIAPPVSIAALTDIAMLDDTTIVISSVDGNVVRGNLTTNTWELITTGFTTYLSKIFYNDRQKILISLSSDGDIFISDDGGKLWAPVSQHNHYLNNIAQSNDGKLLLAVGDHGQLSISDNSGRTWVTQQSPVKTNIEGAIPTGESGFIVYGEAGLLMTLKNLQSSWQIINYPVSEFIHQLLPVTADKWIAVGAKGAILSTNNQGKTWNPLTTPAQENDYFLTIEQDKKSGNIITAGPPGTILLGNADATEWRTRLALGDANQGYFHRIASDNKGTFIAIAGPGQTHFSSDSGESWKPARIDNSKQLFAAIYDHYRQQFVAAGQDGVVQLSPDGKNWQTIQTGITQSLQTIHASRDALWAGGDKGMLIQSIDGGKTWQDTNNSSQATILAFFETQNNSMLAIGTQGYTGRWSNNEKSWQSITTPTHSSLRMPVQDHATGFIYAAGKTGDIIYSQDDGLSWELLPPVTRGSIKSLYIDNHNKMLIGVGERLIRIPLLTRNN